MWVERMSVMVIMVAIITVAVYWLVINIATDCTELKCLPPSEPDSIGIDLVTRAMAFRNGSLVTLVADTWRTPGSAWAPTPRPTGSSDETPIRTALAGLGFPVSPPLCDAASLANVTGTGTRLGILAATWMQMLYLDMRGLAVLGNTSPLSRLGCLAPGPSTLTLIRDGLAPNTSATRTPFLDGEPIYGLGNPTWLWGTQRVGLSGFVNQAKDPPLGGEPPDEAGWMDDTSPLLRSLINLWIREHNRWAAIFAGARPWARGGVAQDASTDEHLFWMARSQTVAQIRAITVLEWLSGLRALVEITVAPRDFPPYLVRMREALEEHVRDGLPLAAVEAYATEPCLGSGASGSPGGRLASEWIALGAAWEAVIPWADPRMTPGPGPLTSLAGNASTDFLLITAEGGAPRCWSPMLFNATVEAGRNATLSAWLAEDLQIAPLREIHGALGWGDCSWGVDADTRGGAMTWWSLHEPESSFACPGDCRCGAWARVQYGLWLTQLYDLFQHDPEGTRYRAPLEWLERASNTRIIDIIKRDANIDAVLAPPSFTWTAITIS